LFIQEEYVDGDDIGRLDCGHDFHAGCIKQWLVLKNLCPICKNPALKTWNSQTGRQLVENIPMFFIGSQDHLPIHIIVLFYGGDLCHALAIGKGKKGWSL
jgi:hypothetical protein